MLGFFVFFFFFFFCYLVQMLSFMSKIVYVCSELDSYDSFPRIFDVWSCDMVVMVQLW